MPISPIRQECKGIDSTHKHHRCSVSLYCPLFCLYFCWCSFNVCCQNEGRPWGWDFSQNSGKKECAGCWKRALRCSWNVSCGFSYSSKTSHLLPGLDEKGRIKELQHFSSTMNFKNGIAVQSNDWYFSKQAQYNCIMVISALTFPCI